MARALKVYRTPIGFHNAYVAAPSQKAALEAWGIDKNLFARGDAEIVIDEALTAEPLSSPGTVIKRLRATADEQVAALPPNPPSNHSAREQRPRQKKATPLKPSPPPAPKPSRDLLEAAEREVEEEVRRHDRAREDLAWRDAALAAERRQLDWAHATAMKRLEAAREKASAAYYKKLERWRD